MRVKAVVAYDGSLYEGFQRQTRTPNTVTGAIERALKSLGICSEIVGSGRTDRGVHSTGQVIHFDIPPYWSDRDLSRLKRHINGKLDAVRFKSVSAVADDFHARYDAIERVYRYIFRDSPSIFERNYISAIGIPDMGKLNETLSLFEGVHDFTLFKKSGSQTSSDRREIYRAYAVKRGDYGYIYFHADGYLRAQVRMMIYATFQKLNGHISEDELKRQIDGAERYTSGLAPAEGLYLARVIYPVGGGDSPRPDRKGE
jgi:tRNA pseudouridine38-40 synthase